MMEFLQQAGILDYALTLFLGFVAYVIGKIVPWLTKYLLNLADESDNALITWAAEEAAELMEERYKDLTGHEKFEQGTVWLAERLQEEGFELTDEQIRGKLQKAYNRAVKEVQ